jgi:hypothetical protein
MARKILEYRIGDQRIIRLIQKWLKAGVLEEGRLIETIEGTPQGSVASPLLANVCLHYVYDLWVQQWRKRHPSRPLKFVPTACGDLPFVTAEAVHDGQFGRCRFHFGQPSAGHAGEPSKLGNRIRS